MKQTPFEIVPTLKPGDQESTENIFKSLLFRYYSPRTMDEVEMFRLLLMAEGKFYDGDFGTGVEGIVLGLNYGQIDDPFKQSGKQFSIPFHSCLLAGGTSGSKKDKTLSDPYVNAINDGAVNLVSNMGFESLEEGKTIYNHFLKKELVAYRTTLIENVAELAKIHLDSGNPRDQYMGRFVNTLF